MSTKYKSGFVGNELATVIGIVVALACIATCGAKAMRTASRLTTVNGALSSISAPAFTPGKGYSQGSVSTDGYVDTASSERVLESLSKGVWNHGKLVRLERPISQKDIGGAIWNPATHLFQRETK